MQLCLIESWINVFTSIGATHCQIQDYKEFPRKRGGSDVSVSSACAVTSAGIQVFYRDESQGILLGAVKDKLDWRYESVLGDKDT